MRFLVSAFACLCVAGGLVLVSAQAPTIGVARYEIVATVEYPDAVRIFVHHLNNKGEVAGRYAMQAECDAPEVSFVWSRGTFREISFPDAFSTRLDGLNEQGAVTGSYIINKPVRDPDTGTCGNIWRQAFFMTPDGEFHTLPWYSLHSVVNTITPGGWMTGPTTPCDPSEDPNCLVGFLYKVGEEPVWIDPPECAGGVDAGDVNQRGDVVGECHTGQGNWYRGYRLRDGVYEFFDYPGSIHTVAWGTNAAGDIVGQAGVNNQGVSFLYRDGRFSIIEVVGAENAAVWDINDTGMITANATTADGRPVGYVARPVR